MKNSIELYYDARVLDETVEVSQRCVLCWTDVNTCDCKSREYLESDSFLNLDEVMEYA